MSMIKCSKCCIQLIKSGEKGVEYSNHKKGRRFQAGREIIRSRHFFFSPTTWEKNCRYVWKKLLENGRVKETIY